MTTDVGELKAILGRIEERVQLLLESHRELTGRFERLLESRNALVERVTRLEAALSSGLLQQVQDDHDKLHSRLAQTDYNVGKLEALESTHIDLEKRLTGLEHPPLGGGRFAKFLHGAGKLVHWVGWIGWTIRIIQFVWVAVITYVIYGYSRALYVLLFGEDPK